MTCSCGFLIPAATMFGSMAMTVVSRLTVRSASTYAAREMPTKFPMWSDQRMTPGAELFEDRRTE
jgi:hypothetical protein